MIVANSRAVVPGAVMSCRVIGVLLMEDEAGGDEKILAVPSTKLTRRYENVTNYTDLPEITLQQIEHFFQHYKDLEPGQVGEGAALGRCGRKPRDHLGRHRTCQIEKDQNASLNILTRLALLSPSNAETLEIKNGAHGFFAGRTI